MAKYKKVKRYHRSFYSPGMWVKKAVGIIVLVAVVLVVGWLAAPHVLDWATHTWYTVVRNRDLSASSETTASSAAASSEVTAKPAASSEVRVDSEPGSEPAAPAGVIAEGGWGVLDTAAAKDEASLRAAARQLAENEKRGVPVTTVVQNYNPRRTSVVLGEDEKVLYGKGFILDTLCGKTYALSPRSFYQVNPVQTAVLYGLAVDAAHLTGKEVVLDAYCGIGTIGLTASDKARQVVGVEVNRDAVRDAIGNAKHNGVKNARFFAADATAWIREAADAGQKADVVFMDPPREGSTPAFLESVARMAPKRIVYVSCNPETMARDLALLTQKGYRAEGFTPVDMFPHSAHCEVVGSLVRVK